VDRPVDDESEEAEAEVGDLGTDPEADVWFG
jgi:hypothetical protein